jgi:ribosomal protein L30/L7E
MFDSEAALRILKYLVGTRELGLCFHSKEGIVLYGTVDASYGMHADRKSHTGITLHIGEDSGSFLTRSKKQTVLADSSTVAEYIAAHSAAKEVQWARSLLEELGYKQLEPTVLYEDNKSTIHMINNESHTQKTKHVDIRYQYIREAVKNQVLTMVHKDTENMTSDIETKPAPPRTFLHLRPQLLGMHSTINMYPHCMEELIDSLSRGDHFCDD